MIDSDNFKLIDEFDLELLEFEILKSKQQEIIDNAKSELSVLDRAIQLTAIHTMRQMIAKQPEQAAEIVWYFYWETNIKAPSIDEAVKGIFTEKTAKEIIKKAKQDTVIILPCSKCGQLVERTVTSRSDKQSALTYSGWRICDECSARDDSARLEFERKARARLLELKTMPYLEYLQTEEWKATRLKALKRAGFKCQVCNSDDKKLNVHHRTYENRGNEQPRDLTVLCEDCHKLYHFGG